jgi:hypothetical protein
MSAIFLYEGHRYSTVADHKNWLRRLQYPIDKGLIFRYDRNPNVRGGRTPWKPGTVHAEGSKWIWRKNSIEALAHENGIDFLQVSYIFLSTYRALTVIFRSHVNNK